jgi:hypothetical protein
MSDVKKIVALFDTHFGFQRVGKKKRPIHNVKAIDAVMQFIDDFKPDYLVHGGDGIDCGAISHWNKHKKKTAEGLRLIDDVQAARTQMLDPLARILPAHAKKIYHLGNHEDWLEDLLEEYPGLEQLVDVDILLGLTENNWQIIPQGGVSKIGKLYFAHGDNVGGQHVAHQAVTQYERSIRIGHHHTYQTATKISAIDITDSRTGVAVPCLCNLGPSYGRNKPNRWINGFLVGYVFPDGSFNDSVVIIVDGRFHFNGRTYKG